MPSEFPRSPKLLKGSAGRVRLAKARFNGLVGASTAEKMTAGWYGWTMKGWFLNEDILRIIDADNPNLYREGERIP